MLVASLFCSKTIGRGEHKLQEDGIHTTSKTLDPLNVLLDRKGKQAGHLEFHLTF